MVTINSNFTVRKSDNLSKNTEQHADGSAFIVLVALKSKVGTDRVSDPRPGSRRGHDIGAAGRVEMPDDLDSRKAPRSRSAGGSAQYSRGQHQQAAGATPCSSPSDYTTYLVIRRGSRFAAWAARDLAEVSPAPDERRGFFHKSSDLFD